MLVLWGSTATIYVHAGMRTDAHTSPIPTLANDNFRKLRMYFQSWTSLNTGYS